MIRSTIPIYTAIHTAAVKSGIRTVHVYPEDFGNEIYTSLKHHENFSAVEFLVSDNEDQVCAQALLTMTSGGRSMIYLENKMLFGFSNGLVKNITQKLSNGMIVWVMEDFIPDHTSFFPDTRQFGKILGIPVLEPGTHQEIIDSVYIGTEISEKVGVPVMIRLSKKTYMEQAKIFYNSTLPDLLSFHEEISSTELLLQLSSQSDMNRFIVGSNHRMGILSCGNTFPVVMEIKDQLDLEFPILKIGQYPLPNKLMHKLFAECREVLILEQGQPVYEEWIRGYFDHEQVKGRLDGYLPLHDELTPEIILQVLLR